MILLDTDVLSAMMRAEGEPTVERWLDAQAIESVWTTTITVFEVHFGLTLLPSGRRRDALERAFTRALDEALGRRVVPFDRPAAEAAGTIASLRRREGRTIEIRDVQIAGIAASRKATLATRNLRHFEGPGVALVDPWTAGAAPVSPPPRRGRG